MPTVILGPNKNVRARYRVPEDGTVEFEVEADLPVKTYIVRPAGLDYFDEGSTTFKYYGGFPDPRRKQRQRLYLPFTGPWYLLIINEDEDESVRVRYEVSY